MEFFCCSYIQLSAPVSYIYVENNYRSECTYVIHRLLLTVTLNEREFNFLLTHYVITAPKKFYFRGKETFQTLFWFSCFHKPLFLKLFLLRNISRNVRRIRKFTTSARRRCV